MTPHNTPEQQRHAPNSRKGHGPSSFWLHEPQTIFSRIGGLAGATLVDAGCGSGDYALFAAALVGATGRIIALDSSELSISRLLAEAADQGVRNISGHVCDITQTLPLDSSSADIVLLFTVLHIKAVRDKSAAMFSELHRVLRPGGHLAIIECKKEDANFGPPKAMRLSEEETEALVTPCGFAKRSHRDLGHTYLLCFESL
jgi:ubiquinone/menaquinone biosynthesis C-methylase UbiE